MSLREALDIAVKLRSALEREVTRSQDSRAVLKTLDAAALLAQASLREAFNQHSAWLSSELARTLREFATSRGLDDFTLAQLEQLSPFEGAQLSAVFSEIRSLSRALAELDEINQQLAEAALTVVRAYVTHLAPQPNAYNRRGEASLLTSTTHSERA